MISESRLRPDAGRASGPVRGEVVGDRLQQDALTVAAAALLRQIRLSRRLTQAEVSARTGGEISKAALANYETGHRSLRIEIFWALARAMGEDPGALLLAAERASGFGSEVDARPVTVDVRAVMDSGDARLEPVRRWFAMRVKAMELGRRVPQTITLDESALAALAQLMGASVVECRRVLAQVEVASAEAPLSRGRRAAVRGPELSSATNLAMPGWPA